MRNSQRRANGARESLVLVVIFSAGEVQNTSIGVKKTPFPSLKFRCRLVRNIILKRKKNMKKVTQFWLGGWTPLPPNPHSQLSGTNVASLVSNFTPILLIWGRRHFVHIDAYPFGNMCVWSEK